MGTNILIRDGQAKLTISAIDILSEYETITVIEKEIGILRTPILVDPIEKSIYELLIARPLDISSLEDILGHDISTIAVKVSIMEVHGIIDMNIDGSYRIV